ncbi:hypothetical protein FGB62_26g210 [Gracilaria domingensis]|nr:hypothetical protein FGB62_26g210 [Gracilaria domingensis]
MLKMRQTAKTGFKVPVVPNRPQDVHIAISDRLKAYSVFTPNGHIEVFDVVGILPHPSVRHESPDCTDVNLKRILEYQHHHPAVSSVSSSSPYNLCGDLVDDLRNGLLGTEPPDEQPMSAFHVDEQVSTITTSSLSKMETGVNIPPEFGNLLTALKVGSSDTACLKLSAASIRKSRNCADLRLWLWKNAEAVFRFLFPYLEPSLNKYGDRDIMAIVTTTITATVSLKCSQSRQRSGLISLVSWFSALCGRISENDTDFNNLSGVIGIHFLLIPIEKSGDREWKVYKPCPFTGQERAAGSPLKNDILLQAIRWAQNEHDADKEHVRRFGAPVEVCTEQTRNVSQPCSQFDSKVVNLDGDNVLSHLDVFEASDFIDISLCKAWPSFLEEQCNAARLLLECEASDRKLALRMLQSAAEKGYHPAMEEIAKCHRQGNEVTDNCIKAMEGLAKKSCVKVESERGKALMVLPRKLSKGAGAASLLSAFVRMEEKGIDGGKMCALRQI